MIKGRSDHTHPHYRHEYAAPYDRVYFLVQKRAQFTRLKIACQSDDKNIVLGDEFNILLAYILKDTSGRRRWDLLHRVSRWH